MLPINEFEILKKFKQSGQKNVYLAKHMRYGLCVLKTGRSQCTASLARIKREVNILKEIKSPFFPKNYEFYCRSDGEFQIIEEYIDGKLLSTLNNNGIKEKDVIRLVIQLVTALQILWNKGIVHRDLKPENIIIREDLTPVIIDLGIARDLNTESLTATELYRGPCTPPYSSPEQLRNEKNSIDERSDYFLIGILWAELLCGYHPFSPDKVGGDDITSNILAGRYFLNEERMSIDTKKIINRLLQPEPFMRYKNYEILKADLENILRKGAENE